MAEASPEKPELSLLIPVHNEAENIPPAAAEAHEALAALGRPYEVLWIDDGSTDSTFEELKAAAARYAGMRVVRLGANYGQTAALSAGIRHARGELIACMDGDRQNDPRDLPKLLAKIDEGFDVASGWRRRRQDPWLTRRLPSEAANAIISRVTGVSLHDYGCTLKIYRSRYLRDLRLYGEMHRFIPAYMGFMGARIAEVEVSHRPRTLGRSKYGLVRILKVILDLMTVKFMEAYLTKPIYLFGGGGLLVGSAGAVLASVTLYKKLVLGIFVKDQPLFQVSIFLALVGFQMVLLGLLAEILIRVYYDIKDKPTYFVREKLNF